MYHKVKKMAKVDNTRRKRHILAKGRPIKLIGSKVTVDGLV